MANYKKGTQQQLDAAKGDATLLPFDTVFITRKLISSSSYLPDGVACIREALFHDDPSSVRFVVDGVEDEESFYANASDLIPAKKQKKAKRIPWQNGTQEDLDNAKDDARLIPKKTYFMIKSRQQQAYRVDEPNNDQCSVYMYERATGRTNFYRASDLEPIEEE